LGYDRAALGAANLYANATTQAVEGNLGGFGVRGARMVMQRTTTQEPED
jgi:hypothetical protein